MVQVSSKLDVLAYVFAPLLLEGQVGRSMFSRPYK
jgi:hypothetical protein